MAYENDLGRIVEGYRGMLPGFSASTAQAIRPYEGQIWQANRRFAPKYAELESQLYNTYAPQYEQVNADIFSRLYPQYARSQAAGEDIYRQAIAESDARLLAGPGRENVLAMERLQKEVDPQFYRLREAGANTVENALAKADALMGGMDPNALTGAEMANAERGINRIRATSGDLNVPSNIGTVRAGLQFDDRLQQKRNAVSQAINSAVGAFTGAGNFATGTRSGIDAGSVALGRAGSPNANIGAGSNRVTGINRAPAGQAGLESSQGFLQLPADLMMFRQMLKANEKDYFDMAQQSTGALKGII